MKMTARVIIESKFDGKNIEYDNNLYPTNVTDQILELVNNNQIDLSQKNKLILVPHTLPEEKETYTNTKDEQKPYLGFTLIGIIKNQPQVVQNLVKIKGKVIYENLTHEFVLVKIQRDQSHEMLKINGILHDSVKDNRGSAVDKYYEITASIYQNSLFIEDSTQIERQRKYYNNVITFPQPVSNHSNYQDYKTA